MVRSAWWHIEQILAKCRVSPRTALRRVPELAHRLVPHLGGGAGLLAGLGVLAIPGVGPVVAAGWLVATAGRRGGGGSGGATGGLIGSLTSSGVTKEHASFYAEAVRRGGALVTARVDEGLVATTEAIMQRHGRIDPVTREKAYRDSGWTEFNGVAALHCCGCPPGSARSIPVVRGLISGVAIPLLCPSGYSIG